MIHNSKIKLSVAIASFNEESCIGDCLNSVKGLADEIVVVDGSSTDKTVEIAKSFNAKVIVTDNKPIFHINKQQAIGECGGEWILQLDADEIIPPELTEEIKSLITNYDLPIIYNAYWIKRKKMFLGKWMKKGGQYPDPVIRLFKNGKAKLPCKSVHEQMVVEGSVGELVNPMIHLPTPSFLVYLTKDNRYSTLSALKMKEEKMSLNIFSSLKYFFCKPCSTFFSIYFRHLGFLDGFPGFVFAFYSGLHYFSAYVKYWEMVKGKIDNKSAERDWV